MKISFFSVFKPFRGGIAQFSDALLQALNSISTVQKVGFKRQYPNFLFPGKTQFVEGSGPNFLQKDRIFDSINPFSWKKTARFVNASEPDVFLASYWMPFFAFQTAFLASRSRAKMKLALVHNLVPHEQKFYDKWANKYFLKRFDAFVVLSEQVKKDVLTMKPDAACLLLEHPLYSHFGEKMNQQEARKKLGLPQDKNILLFFGLIRAYKGLDDLLRAISMTDGGVILLVAGESYGDFSPYENLIHELGISDRVIIQNRFIADGEIPMFFSAANVCVLPYKTATQSGVTAVAQHFELPVIASRVGGLPEVIRHNVDGLLVEAENPNALAEAITSYFQCNKEQGFSLAIKEKKNELTWDNFAKRVLDFVSELQKSKS